MLGQGQACTQVRILALSDWQRQKVHLGHKLILWLNYLAEQKKKKRGHTPALQPREKAVLNPEQFI